MGINLKPTRFMITGIITQLCIHLSVKHRCLEKGFFPYSYFLTLQTIQFVPYNQPNHNSIRKIRPFNMHLNDKFKELFSLRRDVCIDEAKGPFKEGSHFLVFMKDKLAKWGFKLSELCERSAYVYPLEMYYAVKKITSKPVDVSVCLIKSLIVKGHRLDIVDPSICPDLWTCLDYRQLSLEHAEGIILAC
ncbi:hypothetical protein RRG08_005096 [Elysia crispata]|uniref:PiggyBac transposable element-derived protein domain-containing protein n=1 Tax=Elysia crispata TaxID=231223 RepID=A0AAE0XYT2_9GAST|nr:hypothetical protein RRG08_005096 [Elysia crispata]